MPARKKSPPDKLDDVILEILDDLKALDTVCLDVRHLTPIMDTMIITSGRSDRHVRAIADALVERCKQRGFAPLGVEGTDSGEWVLVDFTDVIVHVMLPRTRAFYDLERLWDISRPREEVVES
jgi:ribosome-associated protein